MKFITFNKLFILGLIAALSAAGGLYYYFGGGADGGSQETLTASKPAAGSSSGATVLAALVNLQAVKLDTTLFSDPSFESLSDDGVTIPSQPVGRPNPFGPLGSSGSAVASDLPQNITSGTASHAQ